MQPRVLVHEVNPDAPDEAARAAVSSAFANLPPARSVLAGVISWGDGPGLEPAPWTLNGVLSAAEDAGLGVVFEPLGPHEPRLLHRWLRAHASHRDDERRPITLDVPGARRPRRIPRAWIGRHLCLVVPCVHLGRRALGRPTSWSGPVSSAFEMLALATRSVGGPLAMPSRREDGMRELVGRRVAAQIFASTTIVIDASWWAPVLSESRPRRGALAPPAASHLVSMERCMVLGTTSPAELWTDDDPLVLDTWLGARMGLAPGASRHDGQTPRWAGPAAGRRWPAPTGGLEHRPSLMTAVADKALDALWRLGDRGGARPGRLPPAVPGPLGRHWHELASSHAARSRSSRRETAKTTRRP